MSLSRFFIVLASRQFSHSNYSITHCFTPHICLFVYSRSYPTFSCFPSRWLAKKAKTTEKKRKPSKPMIESDSFSEYIFLIFVLFASFVSSSFVVRTKSTLSREVAATIYTQRRKTTIREFTFGSWFLLFFHRLVYVAKSYRIASRGYISFFSICIRMYVDTPGITPLRFISGFPFGRSHVLPVFRFVPRKMYRKILTTSFSSTRLRRRACEARASHRV